MAPDSTAPGALFQGDAEDSPRRKRVAASDAQRRRQGKDRLPAVRADRPDGRLIEQPFTDKARRGKEDRKKSVDRGP